MNVWNKEKPNQIAMIYGTLIALGLIVYFLLMYVVGLIHVIELRLVNLFIILAGIYFALKQFRRTHDGSLDYFRALTLGTYTAFMGVITFGLYVFLFLKIEGHLMESIRVNESLGAYMNPYIASFAVIIEGTFAGFGLTYMLVNFMNTDRVTTPTGPQASKPVTRETRPSHG